MAAVDKTFGGSGEPATVAIEITPSDDSELEFVTRAIYVGQAGTLRVITLGGSDVEFLCPDGIILPIRATKVMETNTTASYIVILA